MNERGDYVKTALTGCGIAFSLGWLWFPWLGGVWLPGLLWGGSIISGVGAFLLLLVAGFGLGGVLAARFLASGGGENRAGQMLFVHGRRICHIAAYLLLLASLLLRLYGPVNLPGVWPYIAMPAAVLAYIITGLYWGGRLMSLPPFMSALAFFIAAIASALAGQVMDLLPMQAQIILWPQSILLAIGVAEALTWLERPQPKARGRPPKKEYALPPLPLQIGDGESGTISPVTLTILAAVLAAIGFTDGAAWSLFGERISHPPAWLAGLLFGAGAGVPVCAIARLGRPILRGLLSAAAIAVGMLFAALAFPRLPSAGVLSQYLAEGAATGLGLCLLSGAGSEAGVAVRRAGMAGALCVAAMNGGRMVGEAATGLVGFPPANIPAMAASLALLWRPLRLYLRERKILAGEKATGDASQSATGNMAVSDEYAEALPGFTAEEARILMLLVREGLSNQDIAKRLFITRSTVRYHLKKLYIKTDTVNREELVNHVLRNIMKVK